MSCTADEITFNMSASVSVELLCTSFMGKRGGNGGIHASITFSVVCISLGYLLFLPLTKKKQKSHILSMSLLSFFKKIILVLITFCCCFYLQVYIFKNV